MTSWGVGLGGSQHVMSVGRLGSFQPKLHLHHKELLDRGSSVLWAFINERGRSNL